LYMAKPVIVVHGGAWGIPDEQVDKNLAGVEEAVRQGWNILKTSGSALDAVVAAVNSMEDNPIFDAGIGCAHNRWHGRDGRPHHGRRHT